MWLLSYVSCFYMQVTQEIGGHVLHHKNVTCWNTTGWKVASNPFFALSDCDFTSSLSASYPV
jgi:hypothetical protein